MRTAPACPGSPPFSTIATFIPASLSLSSANLLRAVPDAAALVVGVDGQHGDLTHAALGIIDLDRHEADGGTIHLGDPHPRLIRGADVLYRPPLISGNHLKSKFVERAY